MILVYLGPLCEAPNPCEPNPCQNSAICYEGGEDPLCVCNDGYEGELCQININECQSDPCQNGGSCLDGVDEFTCQCAPGFTGRCIMIIYTISYMLNSVNLWLYVFPKYSRQSLGHSV